MAVSKNGVDGLVKGKIGATYYYVRYGRQEMRAAPHISKPRTAKQLAVTQRMTVLSPFLNLIKLYIRVGFQLEGLKKQDSAANCARSYNLKNAIKGEYPNQEVDYPAIRLTEGELAQPLNPAVESTEEGFRFTWQYNPADPSGTQYDRTMLLAWFPENQLFFQVIGGAKRAEGEERLAIAAAAKGGYAETYISFVTDDRSQISNSVYTGRLQF